VSEETSEQEERCPNCQSPDLRADLVLWGNHYCIVGGDRLDPAQVVFDNGLRSGVSVRLKKEEQT